MTDTWNNAIIKMDDGRRAEVERRGEWMYVMIEGTPERPVHLKELMYWLVQRQDAKAPDPLNANQICNAIVHAKSRPWMWMQVSIFFIMGMAIALIAGNF